MFLIFEHYCILNLTWTLLHNNLLINNNDELTSDKL